MLKSVKYRSDAKMVFGIGLVLCALACAVCAILMIPEVGVLRLQWEYFAIIGGAAVLFVLLSLHLLCRAAAWARKEKREEEALDNNLSLAVETGSAFGVKGAIQIQIPESIACKPETKKIRLPKKINAETLKKVGMVAIPAVAVCAAVAAVSSNVKYKKMARRRRQFYRWLG